MSSTNVTQSEKVALSQLVRRLVESGPKTTDNNAPQIKSIGVGDTFSNDGLLLRIIEIEKQVEALNHHRSKALNAILSTIERLENRIARLDGEITGLHEREEQRDLFVIQQKEDLNQSSVYLADNLFKQIEKALRDVKSLISNHDPVRPTLHSDQSKDVRLDD